MAVWLKVTLLLIYLAVLFLLARLIEVVTWYEHGQISRRLLDPMALSVLKLKALLEQRGVSYDAVFEKTELKQLVEATGSVTDEEVESTAEMNGDDVTPITNFTGHLNFYEQVEDAKDSMWLVEVITDRGGLLSDTSWNIIQKKVSKFGVRFGRFDCHLNMRLCARRQWYTPQLLLALPDTYKTKANVALYSFTGPIRISSLFDWIKVKINAQIETISDAETLQTQWLDYNSSLDPEVRVLFISTLSSVPLFLSALSVKFPGRVKIGHIDTKSDKGTTIVKKLNLKKTNGYFIVTKDKRFWYGNGRRETFTFRAFEFFLKSIYPNMNDLFICSMIMTNIGCCFEIVFATGNVIRRFVRFCLCIFKYNLLLMLMWILILGVVQTGIFRSLYLVGLRGLRIITTYQFFSLILKDHLYYSRNMEIPIVTLVLMILVCIKLKSRYFNDMDSLDDEEESDWWNFTNLQTLDYSNWWETTRLRPFDQIFNPTAGIMGMQPDTHFDFQEQIVSKEYIKHLPTWRYSNKKINEFVTKKPTDYNLDVNQRTENSFKEIDNHKDQDKMHTGQRLCGSNATQCPCRPDADSALSGTHFCRCNHECLCRQGSLAVNQPNSPRSQVASCSLPQVNGTNVDTPPISPEEPHLEGIHGNLFTQFSKAYESENMNLHMCKPFGYQDIPQCVICLDDFVDGVFLRGLPCGHVFHNSCILAWLMRENHFCPVCRAPSNENRKFTHFENLHDD